MLTDRVGVYGVPFTESTKPWTRLRKIRIFLTFSLNDINLIGHITKKSHRSPDRYWLILIISVGFFIFFYFQSSSGKWIIWSIARNKIVDYVEVHS